jgi:hypothetical protein
MTACLDCTLRGARTTVRDNGMGDDDITMGLEDRGSGIFVCRACGQRYERTESLAEAPYLDRDYDLYFFQKLEPVLPRAPPPVSPPKPPHPPEPSAEDEDSSLRCPKCRSWDVTAEGWYEVTKLECQTCGHSGFVDWTDDTWDVNEQEREDRRKAAQAQPSPTPPRLEPTPAPPKSTPPQPLFAEPTKLVNPGCASCGGQDAMAAWASLHAQHMASPVREVHFGIDLKQCGCGQPWVVVFAERVDYRDGDDAQTWLAVPVTPDEASVLTTCEPSRVPGGVAELGRDRRFLLRSNFSPEIAWRDSGFSIPPHH